MRLVLALLLLAAAPPAFAQVSTDSHALDQLAPAPAAPAATPTQPAPALARRKPPIPLRHGHVAAAPRRLATPSMPQSPPVHPVIQPPPFVMPAHKPPPPPTVPLHPGAVGIAEAIQGGSRITFGPDSADLNPATQASVQSVAAQALANPALVVSVVAWAPGTSDDPSAARRLSLDRALAARAVLIKAGLASDRIRAVAKGTIDPAGAALDRADLTLTK